LTARGPLGADGRTLIVAVDHPLYSWPCAGLEDRASVLRAVSAAGADAVICSYGTLRDLRVAFGGAAPILKLDVTTLAVGGQYPVSEYAMPDPPEAMADVAECGIPVVLAGGDLDADGDRLLDRVRRALDAGAAGVAHGRNVWGRSDPGAAVAALRALVHPEPAAVDRG
jgi:DhnA family fructose-bisphosphate aldolase class Ia